MFMLNNADVRNINALLEKKKQDFRYKVGGGEDNETNFAFQGCNAARNY